MDQRTEGLARTSHALHFLCFPRFDCFLERGEFGGSVLAGTALEQVLSTLAAVEPVTWLTPAPPTGARRQDSFDLDLALHGQNGISSSNGAPSSNAAALLAASER